MAISPKTVSRNGQKNYEMGIIWVYDIITKTIRSLKKVYAVKSHLSNNNQHVSQGGTKTIVHL